MKISTPYGTASVPEALAKKYKEMSDIELMKEAIKQNERFLDPVLIQILQNKQLLKPGEKTCDLEYKIQILESLEYLKAGA